VKEVVLEMKHRLKSTGLEPNHSACGIPPKRHLAHEHSELSHFLEESEEKSTTSLAVNDPYYLVIVIERSQM
jgi:hypothetical protein